jgi:sugar phosphate isomerase/epimerase
MVSAIRGSLRGAAAGAEGAIRRAAELGIDEVVFYSLFELSRSLDTGELRAAKQLAADLGVGIGAALEWLNPLRPDRSAAELALGGGDYTRGIGKLIEAAAGIGIGRMFFTIGTLEDRAGRWAEQLSAVAETVANLAPVLTTCGTRLLIKTHEEITSIETLQLVETVGPELLGVSFDPVNMLVRLEDPVAAAARLAPYIAQVHIDDAILKFEANGIRRYLCPLGEGIIDWPAIHALTPTAKPLIELHRGQFAMPIFEPSYLAEQDYLTVTEFASVVRMAVACVGAEIPDQAELEARLDAAVRTIPHRAG